MEKLTIIEKLRIIKVILTYPNVNKVIVYFKHPESEYEKQSRIFTNGWAK